MLVGEIWREGGIPDEWEVARIVSIFKGGDGDRAEKYRGVHYWIVDTKFLRQ